MATVLRKTTPSGKESPYWYAYYRSAGGKWIKKSTKERNRAKALEICLGWAHAEREADQGRLTKGRALDVLNDIIRRTGGEEIEGHTTRDWFDAWLTNKRPIKAEATIKAYKNALDNFLAHLGPKADQSIELVTSRDVLGWRNSLTSDGLRPTTVNSRIKIVRMPFAVAVDQGALRVNPANARTVETLPNLEKMEKGVFTPADVQQLLAVATDDWKGAILVAFYTGARLRDIANLKWASIDLHERTLSFVPMKTARRGTEPKRLTLPMHANIEAYFLDLPTAESGAELLFPTLAGRGTGGSGGPGDKGGLSREFRSMMEKAGIPAEMEYAEAEGRGRRIMKRSFHSFRHSFNSALANAGVNQELRQQLTGHASAEMNKLYTHHELEAMRAAMEKLPSI